MDLPADHEVTPYYEEFSIEDQADIESTLPLKPFYDELAVNFESSDGLRSDEARLVAQKQYQVVLYIRPRCPYCVRVMNYLNQIGQKVQIVDVGLNQEAYQRLPHRQVPCLLIDGTPLYESQDIINWLNKHKGQY